MKEDRWGCIIYEDQFLRLDKTFSDDAFGRIMKAALRFGFSGADREKAEELEDPTEAFAAGMLQDSFKRNRESYEDQSANGSIGAAMKYARTVEDLRERLSSLGLESIETARYVNKWKKDHKIE